MKKVNVRGITIGGGDLVLIAGPCVIESRTHAIYMAHALKEITSNLSIPYIFKTSFDKANRSSIDAYRGPGLKKGLDILGEIRQDLGIPITSDIHTLDQALPASKVLDLVQIPAFLCRQTDLLLAAGKTGLPINIKKGQFMAPWDMINVIKKVESTGNTQILLTERGTSFGYNNLICDFRSLASMRSLGKPVVFDVTHSLQLPGGKGDSSGGNREFIIPLARAGVAFGIDALFMEVHDNPEHALSDGPNSLRLSDLDKALKQILDIKKVVG
ncbi:MAG: 3-deoxy-8-phosphooctulonate synthase [Deltaproteobacteria bacterium]|nr:3-deoxy-8-phosphooctulonate synthase [Deltaproteobacteria bacterium]